MWLSFSPQAGHEQSGRRPALTVSPRAYNERSALALFCPLTSEVKGYPFEVPGALWTGCRRSCFKPKDHEILIIELIVYL